MKGDSVRVCILLAMVLCAPSPDGLAELEVVKVGDSVVDPRKVPDPPLSSAKAMIEILKTAPATGKPQPRR